MIKTTASALLELSEQLVSDKEISVIEWDDGKPHFEYSEKAIKLFSNCYYELNPHEWLEVFNEWRLELLPDFQLMNVDSSYENFGIRVQQFANKNIIETIEEYVWDDLRKIFLPDYEGTQVYAAWEIAEIRDDIKADAYRDEPDFH